MPRTLGSFNSGRSILILMLSTWSFVPKKTYEDKSHMSPEEKKSTAIEKALDVLIAFAPYSQEMGPAEISRRLGLHKATASRILLTLTNRRFLRQDPNTKKFQLGRSAFETGRSITPYYNLYTTT